MPVYHICVDIIDIHKEGMAAIDDAIDQHAHIKERHWLYVTGANIYVNTGELGERLEFLLDRYNLTPRFDIRTAVEMFLANKHRWYVLYAEPDNSPLHLKPYYEMRIVDIEEVP